MTTRLLQGKIAVVAGATRGAGRGIACMLGEAGATVYCTGRSVRGRVATNGRTETIEETAEMVTAFGGTGLFHQADHTDPTQVQGLFDRVQAEQGRLPTAGWAEQADDFTGVDLQRNAINGGGGAEMFGEIYDGQDRIDFAHT